MKTHKVRILKIEKIAQNVKKYTLEKPVGYTYSDGQYLFLKTKESDLKYIPITLASYPEKENIELIIKHYKERNSMTKKISSLNKGDQIIITSPMGTKGFIRTGTFLSGGTGINPFISILRRMQKLDSHKTSKNKLIASFRRKEDIYFEKTLNTLLKKNFHITLSEQKEKKYLHGRISKDLIKKISSKDDYFYICGSASFSSQMQEHLEDLGIQKEKIIIF